MYQIKFKANSHISKVQQITNALISDIESGKFRKDKKLPSINQLSEENNVCRDTVEKAYRQLRKRGYIISSPARGYYISVKKKDSLKVLLIFNKLSSFKKIIYDNIIESLGTKARVDLQIHHYNPRILKEIIDENIGKYDFYVVMPHFFTDAREKDYLEVIRAVPAHQLVLLDKGLPQLTSPCRAVYQDFREDIFQALRSLTAEIKKYDSITLVVPDDIHCPKEIPDGVREFAELAGMPFSTLGRVAEGQLQRGTVYVVADEDDLARLLKQIRKSDLVLGRTVGIISFNETIFKELLDITVVSTDFSKMGKTVSKLILGKACQHYRNPFHVIRRGSL